MRGVIVALEIFEKQIKNNCIYEPEYCTLLVLIELTVNKHTNIINRTEKFIPKFIVIE